MKRSLLLAFLFAVAVSANAQTINCTNFCVLGMTIDTAHDELDVTIYNGDTNSVNYPTVVVTDAVGDTVGNINNTFNLFAHSAGDTITHVIPTTLTSLSTGFTGTVYLKDQVWDLTCSFSYPMSCSVGIAEHVNSTSVLIYPNPATDHITIDLQRLNNVPVQINISDITGKLIRTYSTSSDHLFLSREGMEGGLYFVTVVSGDKKFVSKLVIR